MGVFASSVFPFLAGFLGAGFIAKFGSRLRFMDQSNERSSHTGTVPKGGGIGILAAFLVAGVRAGIPLPFLLGATVVSVVSLVGDKTDLPVRFRLFIHMGCAAWAIWDILISGGPGHFALGLPAILYVAGSANIYNFMDGINGIAGMTSVVAFAFLAVFLPQTRGGDHLVLLSLAMAVSSLAFLFFNVPDAKVFMGDVGSILIGFVFSGMVIAVSGGMAEFLCMASFLLVFYLDEVQTMVVRLRRKESVFTAHRRHIYQLLANELGVPHWKVSLGYALFQALICLSMIMAYPKGLWTIGEMLVIYSAGFLIFSHIIRKKAAAL